MEGIITKVETNGDEVWCEVEVNKAEYRQCRSCLERLGKEAKYEDNDLLVLWGRLPDSWRQHAAFEEELKVGHNIGFNDSPFSNVAAIF